MQKQARQFRVEYSRTRKRRLDRRLLAGPTIPLFLYRVETPKVKLWIVAWLN